MKNIRLHFSKTFQARYISHLDLSRAFTRAIRRSGAPVWYTEGFNEHLYLTFALPLSLGFESICETCDIRFLDREPDPYLREKINEGLPFGVEVFNIGEAVAKPGDIGFARYIIELADSRVPNEKIQDSLIQLLDQPSIVIEKKTKKGGSRSINIRDWVDTTQVYIRGENCYLDITGTAESERSFNPMMLLGSLFEMIGQPTDHQLVKRTQILTKDRKNFE